MFEAEHLWNVWVKKDGVNANLVLCNGLALDNPIDFAFSPCLNIVPFGMVMMVIECLNKDLPKFHFFCCTVVFA